VLDAVLSPVTFVLILLIYGFAPGALLRIIVLAFRADDPRRAELRAELYAVPRLERPLWVAEQIEVAIWEGLWGRLKWAATGRVIYRWKLGSSVKAHEKYPETFWIPSEEMKDEIGPGSLVKLMFTLRKGGERMWVEVTEVNGERMVGILSNSPAIVPKLYSGDEVAFKRDHIIDIQPPHPSDCGCGGTGVKDPEPICPCCFHTRNEHE